MPQKQKNAESNRLDSSEVALHQYQKERHAALQEATNRLDELAFKTSERYDEWVLTLSGGALAISLTFIEKIAPDPARWTLVLLGLSWFFYILSILAGFFAIHYSREAIYSEMAIARKDYDNFIQTSTTQKMEGETRPQKENVFRAKVEMSNITSRSSLAIGTALLCAFALINLVIANNFHENVKAKANAVPINLPAAASTALPKQP